MNDLSAATISVPGSGLASKAPEAASLRLEHVTHRYGAVIAVEDVSLEVAPGEILALLGPSGCGKTTLLRIIAGLMRQSAGHVSIGGEIVDSLPPNERGAGIVFQNYALFPHMSVEANVGYGLRARGTPRGITADKVSRMLKLVQLEALGARYPGALSGGQQQRVALARTLAVSPRVLLLDEPFGALDKNLRLDMQIEVKRLQRELGITTVMVTHDQEEALSMADQIAVMNKGRVEQFGAPDEIYDAPATLFVAGFVGTTNLLPGQLTAQPDGRYRVALAAGGVIDLPVARPCSRNGSVLVSVRPEQLAFSSDGTGIEATVRMTLPLGATTVHELMLGGGTPLKVVGGRTQSAPRSTAGQKVLLRLVPGAQPAVFAA